MKHTTALFCTAVLLAAWFGLSSCAQNAFYYPDHKDYGTPAQQGLRYEDVRFASKDGTPLHGWFVPAQCPAESSLHPAACPARATVIHFHGNAQNLSAHWAAVRHLPAEGYNVFLFDYRGYGQSGGTPSQQGLFDDGNAALDYVRTRSDVDKEKLLVFGQSLGGTNAIAVVGAGNKAGVRAVAIESTFASYSKIGNDKIPFAGSLLLRNTYAAERYVAQIAPIPVLFLHGTADQVIAPKHSQILYALAGEPKQLVLLEGGTHLGLDGNAEYVRTLADFFRKHSQ